MKRYILIICISLLLPCVPAAAQETGHMGRGEEFDLPEMSEEIEALISDTPPPEAETAELYRLLKKDAALSAYGANQGEQVYDPRTKGMVTPVRTQRSNTCWAFSSLAAGEASLVYKGLRDPAVLDLSEAQLSWFFYHPVTDPLGNTAGDGNRNISGMDNLAVGSNTIFSTFALAGWIGAAQEAAAPFEGLGPETVYPDELAYADAAHLQNAYWINFKDVDAVNVIKQMIRKYGAVAINFYWSYRYYNSDSYAYYFPLDSTQANNHSAAIVGWDDTFSKEKFHQSCRPGQDGAWIVKNSYGTGWGDGGYFYLSYEDSAVNSQNTSANRARAYVFDFEPGDNYDYNYQYDGSAGAFNATNSKSPLTRIDSKSSIANVFTVKEKSGLRTELLQAVSFALFDTAVSYSIQIYRNPADAANPTSGTPELLVPVTGSTSYAGYYTVPLDIPVTLEVGETFSVVITLEKESGEPVNFFVDKSYQNGNWVSFRNEVEKGQSFRLLDGQWEDLAAHGMTARIKAFTSAGDFVMPERVVLYDVQQDLNGEYYVTLWTDEVYTLQAAVYPAAAEQSLQWETSDASVVNVDSGGVLTPAGAGTAVVTARPLHGTGVSVSCNVTVRQKAAGIALSDSYLELRVGESVALSADLIPAEAFSEDILWSVAGQAVLVDDAGVVEAVEEGTAEVRAYLRSDENVFAVCQVLVKEDKAEPETEQEFETEEEEELKGKIDSGNPENGADKRETGVIEANGAGELRRVRSPETSDGSAGEIFVWILTLLFGFWLLKGRRNM